MSIHRLRRQHRLPRLVLAAWLLVFGAVTASPCVYAAGACRDMVMSDCPDAGGATAENDMPRCGTFASIDCQTSQDTRDTPIQAGFDLTHPAPVMLSSLPAAVATTDTDSTRRHHLAALDVAHPPLNLQHARLLI